MNTLSKRLLYAMREAGLTQKELGKKVNVSQAAIQKITSGVTTNPRNILDIANALDVDPNWLLTGKHRLSFGDKTHSSFNSRLQQAMNNQEINSEEISELLDIPLEDVEDILDGSNMPNMGDLWKITEYLRADHVWLVYGYGNPPLDIAACPAMYRPMYKSLNRSEEDNKKTKELSKWVKSTRIKSRRTQEQLAECLGITKFEIDEFEFGKKEPSNEIQAKISECCKYIMLSMSEKEKNIQSNATILGGIEAWDGNTPLHPDDIEIPFYKDIRLAAGDGFADDIQDYNDFKLRFSKSTLRRHHIQPESVVCVTVNGDSMIPVLPDEATVGINTADINIKDGKMYAINHDGLLRIKILEGLPGNQVRIRSYNSTEYPDVVDTFDNVNIIGRVFWWSVIV